MGIAEWTCAVASDARLRTEHKIFAIELISTHHTLGQIPPPTSPAEESALAALRKYGYARAQRLTLPGG